MKSLALLAAASCTCLSVSALAQDDAWFAALEGLSTEEMGALMLEGSDHGPIVRIEDRTEGMTPPGSRDYWAMERPVRQGDACMRTLWSVSVFVGEEDIAPRRPHARRQFALAPDDPCEFAHYATAADGVTMDDATAMFRLVRGFDALDRDIVCEDETQSDLCRTDAYTRLRIKYLPLNRIRRTDDGALQLWLGQPFTEITVPADGNAPIAIHRRIPAPF